MARTRQIKPEFWTDDDIATLEPCAKLLFIGLWGLADREGRLEDKPLSIHLRILPYERTIDPAILLGELAARRLIRRYVAPGKDGKPVAVIEIRSFRKHQHIHPDEQKSKLPPPPTPEELPTAEVERLAAAVKTNDSDRPRDSAASPEMPGNLSESQPASDFRLPASDLSVSLPRDPAPPEQAVPVPAPFRAAYRPVPLGIVTPAFVAVYEAYPRRDVKTKAAQVFAELAAEYPGGETALRDAILAWFAKGALKRHPYNASENRFRPLLETVLAERRWEDDQSAPDEVVIAQASRAGPVYRAIPRLPAGVARPR